ncbi:MAG: MerR family DNA-binding transcriptional regulator [Clostridiales bacterium]|nr:MerR family DNA-binding transcriptional regulator [Clostridiales bacterium]
MTIKEVSKKFGITMDTLRYYERVGMIPPVTRGSNGNRDYQEEDSTLSARLDLLINQREALKKQRKQIDETIEGLNGKIERYESTAEKGKLAM